METALSSPQSPTTPESIIAQVCRQLTVEYPNGVDSRGNAVDPIAAAAVRDLWGGRVKNFVAVLALREVREILRDRDQAFIAQEARPEMIRSSEMPAAEQPVRDRLHLDGDVFTLDVEDVMRF